MSNRVIKRLELELQGYEVNVGLEPADQNVDVIFRSGSRYYNIDSRVMYWDLGGYAYDIVWWRPAKEEEQTGGYDLSEYKEAHEITSKEITNKLAKGEPVNFHGDFSSMTEEQKDAVINPKHYKIIPPGNYPKGLEYMDICDHALEHLTGVEAHLVGQILKYALRVGKKDAMEQDAQKIEWYAARLVETVRGK